MRRSWFVLIGIGAALVLAAATVVPVASLVVILSAVSQPERCVEPMGSCSEDLTVSQIEELSSVDLPEGAEVVESEYRSALDWIMSATVRLPAGEAAPVLDPDLTWDGATLGPDGVAREVTTVVQVDGRVVLHIRAFST